MRGPPGDSESGGVSSRRPLALDQEQIHANSSPNVGFWPNLKREKFFKLQDSGRKKKNSTRNFYVYNHEKEDFYFLREDKIPVFNKYELLSEETRSNPVCDPTMHKCNDYDSKICNFDFNNLYD